PPPSAPPFPYTTLFRSLRCVREAAVAREARALVADESEHPVGAPYRSDDGAAPVGPPDVPVARVDRDAAGKLARAAPSEASPRPDRKSTRLNSSHRTIS